MAKKVIMPKQGLQMTEGTIISWLLKEGDKAIKGEPLFEMETDKLTIAIDAPESGTLLKIMRGEGETVPITQTIAVIGEPGEDYTALLDGAPAAQLTEEQPDEARIRQQSAVTEKKAHEPRIFITPRAKALAEAKGIVYAGIDGSGPEKLIIEADILAKAAESNRAAFDEMGDTGAGGNIVQPDVMGVAAMHADAAETRIPFTGMRKVIAERMTQSLRTAAQAVHRVKVDMTGVVRLREGFQSQGKKISYNDIISFAVCRALLEFPIMNAKISDDSIVLKHYVNLGIAVALDDGLIVPVIRNAHTMGVEEIGAVTRDLAEKAKTGKLVPDEYTGGSFTISNLGMFGLDAFVAVINPPETGILAVGRIAKTPVVTNSGEIAVCPMAELTLTYDHRVVDGAPAARFLMRIKQFLEQPYLLL